MTILELIALATKRLAHLSQQRSQAETIGDVTTMAQLDDVIAQTEDTVARLRTLL